MDLPFHKLFIINGDFRPALSTSLAALCTHPVLFGFKILLQVLCLFGQPTFTLSKNCVSTSSTESTASSPQGFPRFYPSKSIPPSPN